MKEGAKPVAGEREQTNGWLRRPSHLLLILEWANSSRDEDAKPWAHRTHFTSRGVARLPNGWLAIGAQTLLPDGVGPAVQQPWRF